MLGDMVRVIRMFRPLVIYSRFSGTPADGHGHHQLAGYLTPLAFKAAADPNEFPEQLREGLRPWQAKKLYRGSRLRHGRSREPADGAGAGRAHRSGRRTQLRRDLLRGTQPAQDAGAGRHRAARAAWRRRLLLLDSGVQTPTAGARRSSTASTQRSRAREAGRPSGRHDSRRTRRDGRRREEGARRLRRARARRASSRRSPTVCAPRAPRARR